MIRRVHSGEDRVFAFPARDPRRNAATRGPSDPRGETTRDSSDPFRNARRDPDARPQRPAETPRDAATRRSSGPFRNARRPPTNVF